MKYCINCGKEIPKEALFCPCCGAKQEFVCHTEEISVIEKNHEIDNTEDTQPVVLSVISSKAPKGARIVTLIRNSIMMALALFLVIGSFFPMSNVNLTQVGEEFDFKFSINAFQRITLLFDSFKKDVDESDLVDLQEEAREIYEEIEDVGENDFLSLTMREKNLLNRAFYLMLRGEVQLDEGGPSASLVFGAIFGITNIILAVALFVVALMNLLATFHIVKRGKSQLYKWTIGLLVAFPAVVLATYYVDHLYMNASLSAVAIWSIICVGAVVVMSMVFRYIFAKRDSVRNIVARSIAFILSVVVFCLAFSPVIFVRMKISDEETNRSKNVKVSHGAELFENFAISEYESDKFDDIADMSKEGKKTYFSNALNSFSHMSKKEIQSDYGSSINTEILVTLLGSKILPSLLNLFSTTAVFYILTVISALLVLWQSLYFFVTGSHIRLVVILAKTVAAIAAAIALGIAIACVIVGAYYAKEYIGSSYRLGISAGIVVMTIFSIGASFCPTSLIKKAKKMRSVKVESFYEEFEEQF